MKVIVTVINDLVTDQRVDRSCKVLQDMGFDVLLVGRKYRNSLPIHRSYKTKRIHLLFNKKAVFYAEYNIRLFFFLLFHRYDILFVNDLDVLLANTVVAKIKKSPIIYDSHEYFCGMPELVNRNRVRKFWKKIEDNCIPKVQEMITVNQSIADLYHEEYGINVNVIRNVPIKDKIQFIPHTSISDIDSPFIIYQGAVNIQRGLEEMIMAMQFVDNYKFVIAGDGDLLYYLKSKVCSLPWKDKIIFLGKKTPEELKYYTVEASLGVSPENDSCINYHFCLPNKLFDYINANIPVLVSNLVEMVNIVNTYHIGEIIKSHNPEILSDQINNMLKNDILMKTYKANTRQAALELCWEKESQKLIKLLSQYV